MFWIKSVLEITNIFFCYHIYYLIPKKKSNLKSKLNFLTWCTFFSSESLLPLPIYNVHRYHQFYAKIWRNQLANRLFGDVVDRWLYDGKRISHPFPRFFWSMDKVMEISVKAYDTRGTFFGLLFFSKLSFCNWSSCFFFT